MVWAKPSELRITLLAGAAVGLAPFPSESVNRQGVEASFLFNDSTKAISPSVNAHFSA